MATTVTVENIARDLSLVGENTCTGEYGYYQDDDGQLYVEVWNDSYHGTKAEYRVRLKLEPVA